MNETTGAFERQRGHRIFTRGGGPLRKRMLRIVTPAVATMLMVLPARESVAGQNPDGVSWNIEVHTVGRFQAFNQRATLVQTVDGETVETEKGRTQPGLQHSIGNIGWRLFWGDYLEVFFDATMASRVAADKWWGHQGYMIVRRLPEDSPVAGANLLLEHIDIKAGQFVIDFGNEHQRRTFNADVQRNPLVGNPIVSPHATEVGVEIRHQNPIGLGAMIGFGSGVATESFDRDARPSARGKVWVGHPGSGGMEAAASFYRVRHGSSIVRGSNLFRTDRLGGQYGGIWDEGYTPGQAMLGDGTQLTAWQLDAGWTSPSDQSGFWGFFGRVEDARGPTDEIWNYYGLTGKFYLAPQALYVAARYSAADAQRFLGADDNDGSMDRWQIGAGVHLLAIAQMKVEYVHQRTSGFSHGTLSGVSLAEDPWFSGLIAEVSLSF